MIYVISASETRFVKIGIAANPVSRLRHFQTGIPMTLVLLATADWPHSFERRFHRALRQHHVRGEWFEMCPKINRLIEHMQSGTLTADDWLASLSPPSRLRAALAAVK